MVKRIYDVHHVLPDDPTALKQALDHMDEVREDFAAGQITSYITLVVTKDGNTLHSLHVLPDDKEALVDYLNEVAYDATILLAEENAQEAEGG